MSKQKELVQKIDTHLRRKYGNSSDSSQRRLFQEHDKDGDGKINSDELDGLLKAADIGSAISRGFWVRGIINRMDTDGDGMISWDEYLHAIRSAS